MAYGCSCCEGVEHGIEIEEQITEHIVLIAVIRPDQNECTAGVKERRRIEDFQKFLLLRNSRLVINSFHKIFVFLYHPKNERFVVKYF